MSVEPLYSVVISTYNRGATLRGAIRSVLDLDPASPPHEIIVVDNNSTDDTRAVIESMIPASGGRLRYRFEREQGASHGRNAGAAAARGSVVVFTDDDVRATPGWLRAIDSTFAAHPEMAYTGGPIRPIWPQDPPDWLTDWFWSPLAILDYGELGLEIGRLPFRCLVSANLAVRKAAFDAVGGFDPRFQHARGAVTASEDHELELRLLNAGYRGWYDPSIEMYAEVQRNRLTKAYHRKWAFDHGRAFVRMTPAGVLFDGHATFTPEPPDARHFLGAPLWMYRELLRDIRRYLSLLRPGKRQDRLWMQFRMLTELGTLHEFFVSRNARLPADSFGTSGSFVAARESVT
ncbi:MAG TPA: glycosyltransferase family A protein [Gemmatirosa sp.]